MVAVSFHTSNPALACPSIWASVNSATSFIILATGTFLYCSAPTSVLMFFSTGAIASIFATAVSGFRVPFATLAAMAAASLSALAFLSSWYLISLLLIILIALLCASSSGLYLALIAANTLFSGFVNSSFCPVISSPNLFSSLRAIVALRSSSSLLITKSVA